MPTLQRMIYNKATTYAVLVFTVMWFGFVMPGHQRGIVKLPCVGTGKVDADGKLVGCPMCKAKEPAADGAMLVLNDQTPVPEDNSEEHSPGETPSEGPPGGSCAICFIKANLNLPPEAVAVYLPSWLLDEIELPACIALVEQIENHSTRFGRAPPLV